MPDLRSGLSVRRAGGERAGEAEIDIIKCKGCGTCAAECPARAIDLMHFRTSQLEAKIGALAEG